MSQYRRDAEARLSCNDLLYDKHDLSRSEGVHDSIPVIRSVATSKTGKDGKDTNEEPLGLESYQYEPFGTVDDLSTMESGLEESKDEALRLNNTSWYALLVEKILSMLELRIRQ